MQIKIGRVASKGFQAAYREMLKLTKMPAATSFKLRGVSKMLVEECRNYDETKAEIGKSFAERDPLTNEIVRRVHPDGSASFKLKPEHEAEAMKQIQGLDEVMVEFPEIKHDDLGPNATDLSAEAIYYLEFIVE